METMLLGEGYPRMRARGPWGCLTADPNPKYLGPEKSGRCWARLTESLGLSFPVFEMGKGWVGHSPSEGLGGVERSGLLSQQRGAPQPAWWQRARAQGAARLRGGEGQERARGRAQAAAAEPTARAYGRCAANSCGTHRLDRPSAVPRAGPPACSPARRAPVSGLGTGPALDRALGPGKGRGPGRGDVTLTRAEGCARARARALGTSGKSRRVCTREIGACVNVQILVCPRPRVQARVVGVSICPPGCVRRMCVCLWWSWCVCTSECLPGVVWFGVNELGGGGRRGKRWHGSHLSVY